jgi:hypothetical protein
MWPFNLIKWDHVLFVASIAMLFMAGVFFLAIIPPILIIAAPIAVYDLAVKVSKIVKKKLLG